MSLYWFVSPNGSLSLSFIPSTWVTLNLPIPSFSPNNNLNILNNLVAANLFNTQQINLSAVNHLLNSAQTNISGKLTNNYQNTNTSSILEIEKEEKNFKMDSIDQYIKKTCYRNDDQWSVHFVNKYAISIDEIENVISEFGSAKKINQTGDATGICFINFSSLENARSCVEGLMDHETIQLRENKFIRDRDPKKRAFMNQNRNSGNDDDTNMWNNREDDFSTSSNSRSQIVSEESISDNDTNGIKNGLNEPLTINDTKIGLEGDNQYDYTSVKQINGSERQNKINYNSSQNNGTEIKQEKILNQIITDLKNKKVIDSNVYDYLSENLKESSRNEVIKPTIPELVAKKNIPTKIISEEKSKFINRVQAEELIIANIHEDYSTNYILHLLEKYQPLGATFVKVTKPNFLRYCHVYFMSVEQTEEVKQSFDNFKLGTKNLIVLRSNYLNGISVS